MLTLFLTMQIGGQGLVAQNGPDAKEREFNKQGWLVPGVKDLDRRNAPYSADQIIEGILTRYTIFSPIRNERAIIPLRTFSAETKQTEISVNQIFRYDIDGKAFCYIVSMSPVHDGNVVGVNFFYAFYDEEGKGAFQIKVPMGPLPWHIHLPDWVKKAGQKQ
jgi:hypothetical protein